jgi:hypothetical protein
MFDLGDLEGKRFLAEHWRKRPLFLKGGARLLIERRLDLPEIRILADRSDAAHVERRKGLLSVRGLDAVSLELRGASERLRLALGAKRARIDGLIASSGHGSDCTFERSDRFVLVDRGTQRWRLCPPEVLSTRELRARMLDEPGAGFIHMPDECLDYLVGEEDLLYIPLFWGQWGVATAGPSLALTVTVEADSALELFLPLLSSVLGDERSWWYPLATLVELGHEPGAGDPPPQVDQLFEALLGALRRDSVDKRIREIWWRAYSGAPEKEVRSRTPSEVRRQRVALEELGLDPERVERIRATEPSAPDPRSSAVPGPTSIAELRSAVAPRLLAEVFDVVLGTAGAFGDSAVAQPLYRIAQVLQLGDPIAIAPYVVRPEITSWLWRMAEALSFRRRSYFEEIAYPAPRLLLPALLSASAHTRGLTLPIGRSDELSINLLGCGRRLVSPVPLATRMELSFAGPMLRFVSTAGTLAEFPATAFADRGRVDVGSGFVVEDLPAEPSTGVILLDRDAWVFGQYPRGRRFGARPLEPDGFVGVAGTIPRVAAELEASAPRIFRELRALVSFFLPMVGGDGRAQAVPPFLGSVALSRDTGPHDLAEELGRTKARLAVRAGLPLASEAPDEARIGFEDFVAAAYRALVDGARPRPPLARLEGVLTDWGRAFALALTEATARGA